MSLVTVLGIVACTFCSACVTRRWQNYWAWNDPGFSVESRCSASPELATQLLVTVYDMPGYTLHGATVRVTSSGSSRESQTNDSGQVQIPVAAGHCRVNVELLGFRPAHFDLEIPPGTQCSVKFELDLVGSDVPTVA